MKSGASVIRNLKPRKNRYVGSDTKTTGLAVIIGASGSKYFYYRFRPSGSRSIVEEPIGNATLLSLDDARKAVAIKAGEVAKGTDLKAQRLYRHKKDKEPDKRAELELFSYIEKYYEPYATEHSVTAIEIVRILKREFEFLKHKPIDQIDSHDIEQWRTRRSQQVTFTRIKRIYTYLKACINTAVKHYKLIDRYELQAYTLKRKISEKVNPPKIRYLSKSEEERLLQALHQRDRELREKRARYVEWQAKRNHKKQHQELFTNADIPDHVSPIITIAYKTGFDLGDIFDLHWHQRLRAP